jgi:hypothetical protein
MSEAEKKIKLAIPMKDAEASTWQERIKAATKLIERKTEDWKKQQAAYVGEPLEDLPVDDIVVINKDMPRVKQKVAQLFYQVPEIHLKPKNPQFAGAVPVFQAVLNHQLSKEIKVEKTVDEMLTDIVAVTGIGVTKIGYEVFAEEVDQEIEVDDLTREALLAAGQPIPTEKVPVPIFERYFWKRISPAKLLLPAEFTGTDFDEASWIGFRFRMPSKLANKEFGIDESDATTKDDKTLTDADHPDERTDKEVDCIEIWYKAYLLDDKVKNPLRQRRLVFVGDRETPVVHEDSPYQRWNEDGKLVTGMKRYPIRVLTLTTVPDESIPPSDTKVTRPLVAELTESRTQMVRQRKRSLPLRWYNTSIIDPETAAKIERGEVQDMVPLAAPGDTAIGEVARANYPRESFEFQRVIEGDLMEAWALGSNQMGSDSPGEVSATESRIIQGNTNTRLDYERTKVLRWFLEGVELLGSLVQMFADDQDYVEVVGEDRMASLVQWDKTTIAGEFVFDAKTNSQLRLDVAQERQDARNLYQLMANEPFANRQKLVERVGETHDLDPSQFVAQPPPKQPDMPNVSFRFGGDELSPLHPSFPIVMEILKAGGFNVAPEAIMAAKQMAALQLIKGSGGEAAPDAQSPGQAVQTEHGGVAEQATPLSKSQQTDGDYR